jgi:hypothetical protein
MARQRLPIPFGQGLDRLTGAGELDPRAFQVLENVHLYRGRMEFRKGLARQLLIAWGTDVVGLFPVQAQGLEAAIVYDAVSRDVRLYLIDSTFGTPTLAGTLWTMPADASTPPVVSGVDAYQKLLLAHDEAIFANRQTTKVMDCTTFAITDLEGDLDRSSGAKPIKFRGVFKIGNAVGGWGYGTFTLEDSPHTLRISDPGVPASPNMFDPDVYFQVGRAGDPIIGVHQAGAGWRVAKLTEAYPFSGTSRKSYALGKVMDEHFGLLASRLGVTVTGRCYHWTLQGPRYSDGGPSIDLAMPLDLLNDAHSPATTEPTRMFAFFDPDENEVVWVFDDYGYVLHLKDAEPRWSGRPYATSLCCAGQMYQGGASVPVIVIPTWTDRTGPAIPATALAFSPTLGTAGRHVVLDKGAIGFAKYSDDAGETWQNATTAVAHTYTKCTWVARLTLFIAVAADGGVATSPDGKVWTDQPGAVAGAWRSVIDFPSQTKVIAVGDAGAIMTCGDAGVTWTSRVAPDSEDYNDVVLGATHAVAVATSGAVMRSSNATAWASATTIVAAVGYTFATYLSTVARLAAIGTAISTSDDDGDTWSAVTLDPSVAATLALQGIAPIAYSASRAMAAAVVNAGANPTIALASFTGLLWYSRAIATGDWDALDYDSVADRFVAIDGGSGAELVGL